MRSSGVGWSVCASRAEQYDCDRHDRQHDVWRPRSSRHRNYVVQPESPRRVHDYVVTPDREATREQWHDPTILASPGQGEREQREHEWRAGQRRPAVIGQRETAKIGGRCERPLFDRSWFEQSAQFAQRKFVHAFRYRMSDHRDSERLVRDRSDPRQRRERCD